MAMPVMKFMRNFLQHVVPKRFVRIRYYGIMSNSTKKEMARECRDYFSIKEKILHAVAWQDIYKIVTRTDIQQCKKCGKGKMVMMKILPAFSICDGP